MKYPYRLKLDFRLSVLVLTSLWLASCNEVGLRDNVTDPYAGNYEPKAGLSSGTSGVSSANVSSSSSLSDACTNTYGTNTVTDCRDNHTYKTVVIGTQTWLAENLAYLPSVNTKDDTSMTEVKYYVYDYDGASVSAAKATDKYRTYGVLYNWPAAVAGNTYWFANSSDVKGVCPSGWHLPTVAEWKILENRLGGNASYLKANSDLWINNTGENGSGFSVLPSGVFDQEFDCIGELALFWTSSPTSVLLESGMSYTSAVYVAGFDEYSHVYRGFRWRKNGYSVRCVQNP